MLLPLNWKSLFVRLSLMRMILSVLGLAWEKAEGRANKLTPRASLPGKTMQKILPLKYLLQLIDLIRLHKVSDHRVHLS